MIGAQIAQRLADEYGTPLYGYDLDDIDVRCGELRRMLPARAQLFYSLKANPLPAVVAATRQAGCRAEISSGGELAVALEAGHDPAGMLYTGPGKGRPELEQAVACGVGTVSAESWRDLELVAGLARARAVEIDVILRVNLRAAPDAGLAMAGRPNQFGFDEETIVGVCARAQALHGIRLRGIHVYLGTQIAGAAALAGAFGAGVAAAEALSETVDLQILDLGGGFPWPFASTAAPADLATLGARLAAADLERRAARAELWFESGRYVAASCGTLIARVLDVRRSRDRSFVVLDAGVSQLGGMSGLGRVLAPAAAIVALVPGRGGARERADVVGPLCTPLDCIARGVAVPDVEPGDLVAVPNTGAYGATASLSGFLSRRPAVEVALRAGAVVAAARLRSGHESVPSTAAAVRDDDAIVV